MAKRNCVIVLSSEDEDGSNNPRSLSSSRAKPKPSSSSRSTSSRGRKRARVSGSGPHLSKLYEVSSICCWLVLGGGTMLLPFVLCDTYEF